MVEVHGPNYEAGLSLGTAPGSPTFGGFFKTSLRQYNLTLGDDTLPFVFPTDIFNQSHYFFIRGLGIQREQSSFSWHAFAGATATGFNWPFFRSARSDQAAGGLFVKKHISPTLNVFSSTLLSTRQTSISGAEWQYGDIKTAVAGGIGANQPYIASSVTVQRPWVVVKAAYSVVGQNFQRTLVREPVSSEADHENVLITLWPRSRFSVTAARQNIAQIDRLHSTSIHATLNEYVASFNAGFAQLRGQVYQSQVYGRTNVGSAISARRTIGSRLQASGMLLSSRVPHQPSLRTVVTGLREVISPKLSLNEDVSHTHGNTSFALGGEYSLNRISVGVQHQYVFLPFATGNPFRRSLFLSIRLRPFGSHQLGLETFIAPDGTVKYTAQATSFLYGSTEEAAVPMVPITIERYVVRGRVTDTAGQPVRGATLQVGTQVVFTDSEGRFYTRFPRPGPYPFQARLKEFLIPGSFEVVSAPSTVYAVVEAESDEPLVVIRRVP
jgi:hypothetical protein